MRVNVARQSLDTCLGSPPCPTHLKTVLPRVSSTLQQCLPQGQKSLSFPYSLMLLPSTTWHLLRAPGGSSLPRAAEGQSLPRRSSFRDSRSQAGHWLENVRTLREPPSWPPVPILVPTMVNSDGSSLSLSLPPKHKGSKALPACLALNQSHIQVINNTR